MEEEGETSAETRETNSNMGPRRDHVQPSVASHRVFGTRSVAPGVVNRAAPSAAFLSLLTLALGLVSDSFLLDS